MNTLYFIGSIIIIKLIDSFYKRNRVNQELNVPTVPKAENETYIESPVPYTKNSFLYSKYEYGKIETDIVYEPTEPIKINESKTDEPEIVSKNKWLYPTDGLGKLERGRCL